MTNDSISKLDQIALCYDKMSCHLPVNAKKSEWKIWEVVFLSQNIYTKTILGLKLDYD